ncbi:WD40 repeat protein [Streptomyces sp. SAI-126]|uniref:nSTAND1 domain-containing NTPase n=1 Tax=Streptomyces sp. SAI-126 TaxID=3377732 RepID=UPI003C7A1F21
MGRPERPVDPSAGPVARFAHDLRQLRIAAGSPSYRTMAKEAGCGATTLSQAASGERLPALAVVEAYVRACGGDPAPWRLRWKETEQEADRARAAQAAPSESAPAPYRGLARFEPDDRHLFFGRDRMLAELGKLVCGHRFAMLFGPSGSGKSSLLRAGLVPRLREELAGRPAPAALRILTPGASPATTYGHLFNPAPDEPESWVIVDQFEEVFTLCDDPRERSRFIEMLLAAREPGSRVRVLVAVRADFYARCAEHPALAQALNESGLLLCPMTAEELREAVVRPAQAAGHLVERALTARLVEEVQTEPGGLPMLSHVLLEIWRRRRGRMLTFEGYEAAGGLHGAIAATAEKVYGALSPEQARSARHLLLRMVVPGRDTPDTRCPLPHEELSQCPEAQVVLERLTRARLLTADEDGVHLAHEALITCWPRLRDWIEEDRERLRHHRTLTEAARLWREHGQCPGTLYRGAQLARAAEHFPQPADHPALAAPERAFLTASLEARETERLATARIDRRHRLLTRSLSAVLAVALLTAFAVWREHDDVLRRRTQEAARRVAEVANGLRSTDPRTARLLGAASWRIAQLPETRRALLGSLAQPESDTFTDPTPGDTPQRHLTDDGSTLLSVTEGTWRRWDVTTHRRTGAGGLPKGMVTAVGPHARVLAISRADGTRLWDTTLGRWTAGSAALPGLGDVHLTGDGRAYLVTDGTHLRLGSITDGRALFEAPAPKSTAGAVSADGRYVAACPAGRSPRLWDTTANRVLTGGWQQDRLCHVGDTELTVGAGRLAAVTGGGVRVWDLRSGRRIADLNASGAHEVSFSAGDAFLALATPQEVQVWRLSAPDKPVFRAPLNNQELGLSPALAVEGHFLRYLEGGTVHSLDLGAAVTADWRPAAQADVVLSPDGRTFATAELADDRFLIRLCSTADGRVLHSLPPLPATMPSVPPRDIDVLLAFSTDGTRLGYGVTAAGHTLGSQSFTIWDVPHERAVTTLALPGASVAEAALGPRGRSLHLTRLGDDDRMFGEVWDTRSRRRTKVPAGPAGHDPTLRGDGRLLAGDGVVARPPSWRSSTLDLLEGSPLGALAFSSDGSRLAAGDMTGRVTLWDGALRHRTPALPSTFRPAGGPRLEAVSALAFSPDGHTLAVGGDSGGLQLWDVPTGQPIGGLLTTPGDAVHTLAFSPDGTTLYAGSAHVPLQRYDLDPAHALARVCAGLGGPGLSRAQWQTYVPDAPYRRVCPAA